MIISIVSAKKKANARFLCPEPMFGWDYCNLRACKLVLDNYTEVAETVKNTDTVVLDE